MNLKNKRAFFFDLDGTLIDSSKDLAVSVNYMLKEIGRERFEEAKIQEWVGNGAQVLTKRALSGSIDIDKNLDERLVKKALQIMLDYYSKHLTVYTNTYPNVKETLQILKSRGYKLVIITNKPYNFISPILKSLQMEMFFEFCLGGDSLKEKKPHPMPLHFACDKLNIANHDAVMVGDSKNDIIAARSVGIDVVAVTYGYNHGESLDIYNPNIIVEDFSELIRLIS